MKSRNIIALFGGTFDPIHNGHLHIATTLMRELPLKEVRFIPCKTPVLKGQAHASTATRVALLEIALQPFPNFRIDQREIVRDTPSYMVDTLQSIRREVGNQPLALIIGADAFSTLDQWYHWQQLPTLCHFIVINRPGYQLPTSGPIAKLLALVTAADIIDLQTSNSGKIYLHTIKPMSVSASMIRQKLLCGEAVDELLPVEVIKWIEQHHVYRDTLK